MYPGPAIIVNKVSLDAEHVAEHLGLRELAARVDSIGDS